MQAGTSGRTSYPDFLSLPETLRLHAVWAGKGLVDAFRWDVVISAVLNDSEIRMNMLKSLVLNSVSLSSIYVFDLLLAPLIKENAHWTHRHFGWFYQVLWLFPVVGVSLYLNSSWCAVIAKRIFMTRQGRQAAPPSSYNGMLTMIATSAYRAVMVVTSSLVSISLNFVPVVGPAIGLAFFCWVDAFYCFEFIWIAKGMSLTQRIKHLEERWAYYLAFGLPSSTLCMVGSSLANATLFALLLPSYIIMATHAHPVPLHPYNPTFSSPASGPNIKSETAIYPSPFIPIRMPIFALVIWLNDIIVWLLSVGGTKPVRRPRGLSESSVISVEEGSFDQNMEIKTFSASLKSRAAQPTLRISRKKLD